MVCPAAATYLTPTVKESTWWQNPPWESPSASSPSHVLLPTIVMLSSSTIHIFLSQVDLLRERVGLEGKASWRGVVVLKTLEMLITSVVGLTICWQAFEVKLPPV